ncbi:MAG: leucine-rich repeat domain-containing protein [Clostridia bacterium]|nr:leucine-rich repeat domain-containing protein [Clostridia bacterium]
MKKKILLTALMVVAFIFAFVVSAFAEDIVVSRTESEEYGTVIQLSADPGLDNASQYASTLKKINDSGDSTQDYAILTDGTYYYVFPSSYIVLERDDGKFELYADALAQAMAEFNDNLTTTYYEGYSVTGTYAGRRLEAIVRFEFPSDVTFAHQDWCCMRSYPKLTEVRVNHPIDFSSAEKMFQSNNALLTVDLKEATGLAPSMFYSCKYLQSVNLPTDIVKIPNSMFFGVGSSGTGFTIPNLLECTQLTTIGQGAFRDSGKITISIPDSVTTIESEAFRAGCKTGSVTISNTSKLETIGSYAFLSCVAIKTIYIPSTVTSIGEYAFSGTGIHTFENFENCQITTIENNTFEGLTSLKTITIPKTVTKIENAFLGNKNLKTVYIPKTLTSIDDTFVKSAWEAAPTNIVFVFTGKDTSVFANCSIFTGANVIAGKDYNPSTSYTGINLVVGYSDCVVYNGGVHGAEVNSFEITSYLEPIKLTSNCAICDMVVEANGQIPALFESLGYSAPENGIGGISIGYRVNSEAIEEYEEKSGKKINYGLFVGVKDIIGTGNILDENGDATQGVVKVAMPKENFLVFSVKIVGFGENQKDTQFAFGAYVIAEKNGTKEIGYMQEGTKKENDRYVFTSFNEVVAFVKSKEQ